MAVSDLETLLFHMTTGFLFFTYTYLLIYVNLRRVGEKMPSVIFNIPHIAPVKISELDFHFQRAEVISGSVHKSAWHPPEWNFLKKFVHPVLILVDTLLLIWSVGFIFH